MIHEIKKYIKHELKKGYSLPVIREELMNKGFSDDEINSALHETTTPRISIVSLTVLVLGVITLNALLMGIFVFLPLAARLPAAVQYLLLFLVPFLTGLLNFWVISEAVVDSIEKNFAGIITPLPFVIILHNFLAVKTAIPALFPVLWYFTAHYWAFAQENIIEKSHPWKWIILAASFLAVALLVAPAVNITELTELIALIR